MGILWLLGLYISTVSELRPVLLGLGFHKTKNVLFLFSAKNMLYSSITKFHQNCLGPGNGGIYWGAKGGSDF